MKLSKIKLRRRIRHADVPLPALGAIAVTRGLLGMGAGLLLSKRIPERRRRVVGLSLLGIGVATTLPLATFVLRRT